MNLFEAEELRGKTQPISLEQLAEAYRRVRVNRGGSGVDGQSLSDFDNNKSGNLYKLWNRMASGSYFPQAVRGVEIPKKDGSYRLLGIPTVSDRTA